MTKLWKSLIASLLLIATLTTADIVNEVTEPLFSLPALSPPPFKGPQPFISKEAARVVLIKLDNLQTYLMRVDPPEHCSRVVLCAGASVASCAAVESILLLPLDNQQMHSYDKNSTRLQGSGVQDVIRVDRRGGKIDLTFKQHIFTAGGGLSVKTRFLQLPFIPGSGDDELRVETSSFYCRVNVATVGTLADNVPAMRCPKENAKIASFWMGRAPLADGAKSARSKLGRLFTDTSKDAHSLTAASFRKYTFDRDDKAHCLFVHDWMGFSLWSSEKAGGKYAMEDNAVWQYHLKDSGKTGCGKAGSALAYQLDIEVESVFEPMKGGDSDNRCFGFALSFTKTDGSASITVRPQDTFEFYVASLFMLVPDSNKMRQIRSARSDLRHIRISFYKKDAVYDRDYAIVEYNFLNDKIAGVREYVEMPGAFYAKGQMVYKFVSLFVDGKCDARVLNVNHQSIKSPRDRCWNLVGCDVLNFSQ